MENQENQTENILDNKERAYATGKRKNSIARVWLKRGSGEIKINGKPLDKYFLRPVLQMIVNQPLDVVKADNSYEIMASVKGGGLSGQAGAIRHGISKALSLSKKSTCPDHPEAIIGLPVKLNSNKGLPHPSPLVKLTIALILG